MASLSACTVNSADLWQGKQLKVSRLRAGHEETGQPIMRSLPTDVEQLCQAGVHVLVCLLNDAELRALGIKSGDYYRAEVSKKMQAVQFPIVEGHAAVGTECRSFVQCQPLCLH